MSSFLLGKMLLRGITAYAVKTDAPNFCHSLIPFLDCHPMLRKSGCKDRGIVVPENGAEAGAPWTQRGPDSGEERSAV